MAVRSVAEFQLTAAKQLERTRPSRRAHFFTRTGNLPLGAELAYVHRRNPNSVSPLATWARKPWSNAIVLRS